MLHCDAAVAKPSNQTKINRNNSERTPLGQPPPLRTSLIRDSLSRPLWFNFGKQKLHAAFAVFGLQNTSPNQPHAIIVMAAMRYHGHILGWMMSAAQLNTFNDLTKTSIELDDGKVYPLVPFNLDDHLRLPINIVK